MTIRHTAKLPHGYVAEFIWRDGHLDVLWEPDFPRIESEKAKRRFIAAYQQARDQFMEMVAAATARNIAILDTGHSPAITVVRKPTLQ